MSKPMHKVLVFLKRKPGMSVEDFRAYYENNHAPLCEKYLAGVSRYVRRYVDFVGDELPFDVVTELWTDNRKVAEQIAEIMARGPIPDEVIEDELKVFDRPQARVAIVTECDTKIG